MDTISRRRRSENMRRIRSRHTRPEMSVRSLVHRLGFRYRLHDPGLPGSPDLAFPSRKKAIFVHGCFWHQHRGCVDGHVPRSRTGYWKEKLRKNVTRDRAHVRSLQRLGWQVLTLWECETTNLELLARRINRFLRP